MVNRTPRPHQERALSLLRAHLLEGKKRPMLQMPTGSGKTFTAAMVIHNARAKGNRVIFVVPAISLIDQTVEAFWEEGIRNVGVIQGDHPQRDFSRPVQVASIQTLQARGVRCIPDAGLVIVDEAHRHFEFTSEWMNHPDWQKVRFIGLSATPWAKGLGKHYDSLVVGETVQGLIDAGILAPFRVFAPAHPDLSGVKTQAGDYHEGQLAAVMSDATLVANVVATWLEKGENRPTLCFAVNRAHARKLQDEFQQAGVRCGYVDAFTKPEERADVKARFERGELPVVVNIGTLTTGVDWDVRCVIMARPTKSEMLFVQCIGRALRTAPGKTDALILDHADNTLRMGFVTDIGRDALCDGSKRRGGSERKDEEALPKECKSCSYLKPPKVAECPNCGFKPQRQTDIVEAEGELVEITPRGTKTPAGPPSRAEMQLWYSGFLHIRNERGYKPNWPDMNFKQRFGSYPDRLGLFPEPTPPPPAVRSWVIAQQIRYAKSRQKEAV